jgi:hypothetical protein
MFYIPYRIVRWLYLLLFPPPFLRPAFRRTTMPMPPRPVAPERENGDSPHLCEAPSGPFRQMGTVPVFPLKPRLVRLRELIGSLLVAAAVTAAMCVVMVLIMAYNNKSAAQPEQCAWLFLVSLAGAWIVLIAGKCWEGSEGEPMLRRFILMTLGLGLGLVASGAADAFLVHLLPDAGLTMRTSLKLPAEFYRDGRPQAMAYMAAFATLLALVRWWRQSDPLRAARLSLVSLIVTVIGAHLVAVGWQFPEPWLMMVAGCMSISVQLASPWVPTYARLKPQRKRVF